VALSPASRLGPYEILASIGTGGMGEVYTARDTRLDRTVALKVSQAAFTDRFEREARTISALNHPNVCQLYDVGPNYLVMEWVDGAPIAPVDTPRRLLDLAVQIADGLAAAHAAGIVHRDLKPDNILVTRDGRVKILDFGLAKALGAEAAGAAAGRSLSPTMAGTEPGTILGTVHYMSPEQARGDANLTPQSDQFSLGLVLYELAAGKKAFARGSSAETLAAIIREEAEPLPGTTPAPLRWAIARLLSKDPSERYDSSRDLYRELRQIRERLSEATSASGVTASVGTRPRRSARPWAMPVAALLVGAVLTGLASTLWRAPATSSAPDLSGYTFTPIAREEATEQAPAWSPDGRTLAYTAVVNGVRQVFVRAVGSPDAAQITRGTTGAANPAWSPDGSTIYFTADTELWAVGSAGGAPERVVERVGNYAIHPDGRTIVFNRGPRLWAVTMGEEPREIELPDELASTPNPILAGGFSPHGSSLVVVNPLDGVLWVLPYPSGTPQRIAIVGPAFTGSSWMPDSRRLVVGQMREDGSFALSILDTRDGSRRVLYASPEILLSPAVSPDGTRLAFSTGRVQWHLLEVGIPDGRVRTLLAAGGISVNPAWSPSGASYLFSTDRSGQRAIEEVSATGHFSRRVVEAGGDPAGPQWAPDGSQFTFSVSDSGSSRLMLATSSGARTSPLDPGAPGSTSNAVWSPDGRHVVYVRRPHGGQGQVEVARIRPGSTASPEILATHDAEGPERRIPVAWSPDGDWILSRASTGARGLFLVAPDFTRERHLTPRVFAGAGFSRTGREVVGVHRNTTGEGAEWQLWSIDVATGRETRLADLDLPDATDSLNGFSLHPDGTRFATAIALWPYDIWMLEGFDRP
jgi:Tol biopolymer transport system component